MTQDLSMYGSQASGGLLTRSLDLLFGDNKNSQIADGGLDVLGGLKGGLFDDCNNLLGDSPIPLDLDVPDFDSEWMEGWINLDNKMLLFDDLSALDDALALAETKSHEEESGQMQQNGEPEQTSMIDDTISQLLQLKAMADPESNISPESPSDIHVPEFEVAASPEEILQTNLQLHSETLLSPSFQANLSPSCSSVTTESVFNYPVISCPSPESDSSVELEVQVGDFNLLEDITIESTTYSSTDQSDDSCHSDVMSPPSISRNKRKAGALNVSADIAPSTKRTRKSNPRKQSGNGLQVKKERKRDQNKTAATRYRLKKRSEQDLLSKEESLLLERNTELKSSVDKLANEIGYLKGLMREILAKRSK